VPLGDEAVAVGAEEGVEGGGDYGAEACFVLAQGFFVGFAFGEVVADDAEAGGSAVRAEQGDADGVEDAAGAVGFGNDFVGAVNDAGVEGGLVSLAAAFEGFAIEGA